MIKSTKNYDMFKFRDDNREKIKQHHVNELIESIKQKNMLDIFPIIVNEKMEILQGQHRFLAARQLNIDIYYQIMRDASSKDLLLMNVGRAWGIADYLNFYVKNGNEHYIKLKSFMEKYDFNLKVAVAISINRSQDAMKAFKDGIYKFDIECYGENLEVCFQSIEIIRRLNGAVQTQFTRTSKFWMALIKLTRHPNFDAEKWLYNLTRLVGKFSARSQASEYVKLMQETYNWHNNKRIELMRD